MKTLTPEEEASMFARLVQEIHHKEEAERMTDRELASALCDEVWAKQPALWKRPAVLVDEAIRRLKRHDTQRRWDERKARRVVRGVSR